MTDNKFGGQTTWEETDQIISSWNGGWEAPGQDFVIDKEDVDYWDTNLLNARRAYGDPNIRYNTDDTGAERYLQFGDGTRLPSDGTLVYHDSASKQNWINNGDGTFTKADQNFQPTGQPFPPAGYRKMPDGRYAPIDARGNQVGALNPTPQPPANFPGSPGWHTKDDVATPLNTNGDFYEIDPATGQHKYFDKYGKPISKDKYFAGTPFPQPGQSPTGQPPAPGTKAPLQSAQVVVPDGMTAPKYPSWATDVDPDVPNQLTGVVVRLYELFGKGTPAESDLPEFPFSTDTGKDSGIDAYDKVKKDFTRIEGEFNSTAQAYKQAVQHSANVTKAGRDAINNAVNTFNSTVAALEDGDWDGLLQSESTLLDSVKQEVQKAAGTEQPVPQNPTGGPQSPMTPPPAAEPLPGTGSLPPADPMATPSGATPEDKKLDDLLNGLGAPLGGMGGMNPLGALGGMNPLGGLGGGNPMGGGGGSPLSPLADAIKPLTKMADQPESSKDDKKPAITPLNPSTPPPGTPAGTPPAQGGQPGVAVVAPAGATPPTGAQPGQPNAAPAANAATKPTVTLPDGKVVEAPNQQAAQAAQRALDEAAPGGDPAQKAYSDTGVQLPSDGKNMGAKIDPSDMQPGDVLKFHDKTMVAVAPGLVADPTHPGVTHTIADVLKDGKGFEGVFRPTATDPTLSAPNTPPPLTDPPQPPPSPPSGQTPPAPHETGPAPAPHDPPQPPAAPPAPADPPPDSVPLSGPAPGQPAPPAAPPAAPPPSPTAPQAAPPSPFETPQPPPATRTTRQDRIAAGIE